MCPAPSTPFPCSASLLPRSTESHKKYRYVVRVCVSVCACARISTSVAAQSLYKFSCITKDVQNLRLLTMQRHKSHTHTHTHTSDKQPTIVEEGREREREKAEKKFKASKKQKQLTLPASLKEFLTRLVSMLLRFHLLLSKFRLG